MNLYKITFNYHPCTCKIGNIIQYNLYTDKLYIHHLKSIRDIGLVYFNWEIYTVVININFKFDYENNEIIYLKEIIEYIKQSERDKKLKELV